jgi:hypothetical protein
MMIVLFGDDMIQRAHGADNPHCNERLAARQTACFPPMSLAARRSQDAVHTRQSKGKNHDLPNPPRPETARL